MRTTVELPDDLVRAAKIRAAERGESLKELFARAVAREIEVSRERGEKRVALPLIPRSGDGSAITVTSNTDVEAIFAAEDAERYGES